MLDIYSGLVCSLPYEFEHGRDAFISEQKETVGGPVKVSAAGSQPFVGVIAIPKVDLNWYGIV